MWSEATRGCQPTATANGGRAARGCSVIIIALRPADGPFIRAAVVAIQVLSDVNVGVAVVVGASLGIVGNRGSARHLSLVSVGLARRKADNVFAEVAGAAYAVQRGGSNSSRLGRARQGLVRVLLYGRTALDVALRVHLVQHCLKNGVLPDLSVLPAVVVSLLGKKKRRGIQSVSK